MEHISIFQLIVLQLLFMFCLTLSSISFSGNFLALSLLPRDKVATALFKMTHGPLPVCGPVIGGPLS